MKQLRLPVHRVLIGLFVMIAAVGCSDSLFVSPERTPTGLGLSFSLVSGLSADVAAAFDAADEVRVSVSGPGVSISDRSFPFAPTGETRVGVEIEGAQSGATYQVTVRLLDEGRTLFVSSFSTQLNVGQPTPVDVTLTPVASTIVPAQPAMLVVVLGQPTPIQVTSLFATGDTIPQGAIAIDWSSDNPAVATVDAAGIVMPLADGQAVITARSGTTEARTTVTVLETPARNVRVCATGGFRTFSTLAMAVDSVASGGTIRFCSGTFPASALVIAKPLTLEAEAGATPVIAGNGTQSGLGVRNPTGTITIRGLHFSGHAPHAVNAAVSYAGLLVEDATFDVPADAQAAVFAGVSDIAGATATVRRITAIGGQIGAFASNGATLHVLDSRFERQTFSNIQHQTGAGGSVLRNSVEECGENGCIRARFAGSLLIADNTARTTARRDVFANGVRDGILADGENVIVDNNRIEGIGAVQDPGNRDEYPFFGAGLVVFSGGSGTFARATFTRNTVINAATGIAANGPDGLPANVIGADNVFVNTQTGVTSLGVGTFDLHRSDFTNAVFPIFVEGALAAGSLSCNWWGSPNGPQTNVDPAVYSPFATSPIAGTSIECPAAGTASLSGTVVSASTGQPVSGALIELRQAGSVVSVVTSSTGAFAFGGLTGGTYNVRITAAGFADFSSDIDIAPNQSVSRTFAIPPAVSGDQVRIVLTWSAVPEDLDSHLEVPAFESNPSTFVYFGNPGSATSYPFATLDVDDVDGFGPETIAIEQQVTGTYTYFVHNFSGEAPLSASGAVVEVYRGNTRIGTFSVPSGSGDLWTVFSLNGTTLTPINQMGTFGGIRGAESGSAVIRKHD